MRWIVWRAERIRFWAELKFYRQMWIGNLINQVLITAGFFGWSPC